MWSSWGFTARPPSPILESNLGGIEPFFQNLEFGLVQMGVQIMKSLTPQQKEYIQRQWSEKSAKQIADDLGCSKSSVYNVVNSLGLRKKGERRDEHPRLVRPIKSKVKCVKNVKERLRWQADLIERAMAQCDTKDLAALAKANLETLKALDIKEAAEADEQPATDPVASALHLAG